MSSRNRTLQCSLEEQQELSQSVIRLDGPVSFQDIQGQLVCGDFLEMAEDFPEEFIDLLILDPPYNLTKNYHGHLFKKQHNQDYRHWFRILIEHLVPMIKPHATIYVCSDWQTSTLIVDVLAEYFLVQNRITWEREKGRGAKRNWKNNTEDIWFCSRSPHYTFNVEAVKLKRQVRAPYRQHGVPKDWVQDGSSQYRRTHPSNIWTDITIPFWSMAENTPHPTQKPEKLMAKLILASSHEQDFIFDPFVGCGTTAVVAQKLGRRWCGVDQNMEYLCWAQKRLQAAQHSSSIQGYDDGVFWERNSLSQQNKARQK